jgi:hypothetical protein
MGAFDDFVRRMQKDHSSIPELVIGFFREVLDARGVPVLIQGHLRKK